MKATAELKMLPVSVLKPAAYNPRKKLKPGDKEYEKIKNSITEFGFADPLVVNADMTIIGGHQRLTVAMDLGYTEVPCAVVDIDKTREKALNIALNKITGAWDDTLLADLLKDIEESNFDLGKTGFDPPEIETLFNKVHSKEVKEDDFDVESELKQPCFSKEGDLWMLGKHRVLCGDSTKAECYDTLMDGVKANLVLSDPPYKEMDWSGDCRYKILGYRIEFEGEALYVFDLVAAEVFHECKKKQSADQQPTTVAEENTEEQPVNPRKGYYPDDIAGTFGMPVEQHRQESELRQMDGFVSVGMLTGMPGQQQNL